MFACAQIFTREVRHALMAFALKPIQLAEPTVNFM